MIDENAIRQRWEAVGSKLDERGKRLFAACEVRSAGWGGLAAVSKITGLARSTINRGEEAGSPRRRRASGGLRKRSGASPRAQATGRTGDVGRSDAAVDLGIEKHGEAVGGSDRDGASDQCRYRAQRVGETGVLAPVQPQGG